VEFGTTGIYIVWRLIKIVLVLDSSTLVFIVGISRLNIKKFCVLPIEKIYMLCTVFRKKKNT
jgi:hypothetical protein